MHNFDDVKAFHEKFELPINKRPGFLPDDQMKFRQDFLEEELNEFKLAVETRDLHKAFDALLDIVYVALGTAVMMGLPWQRGWKRVQEANMKKVRASSADDERNDGAHRKHSINVVKPEGWRAPILYDLVTVGPPWDCSVYDGLMNVPGCANGITREQVMDAIVFHGSQDFNELAEAREVS